MSTKTLRKRISLVAVSALGAGLLSIVSMPASNAATFGAISVGTVPAARAGSTITVPITINVTPAASGETITVAAKAVSAPTSGGLSNAPSVFASTVAATNADAAGAVLYFGTAAGQIATTSGGAGTGAYSATAAGVDKDNQKSYIGVFKAGTTTAGNIDTATVTGSVPATAQEFATSGTTATTVTAYLTIKPDLAGTYTFIVSVSDSAARNSYAAGDQSTMITVTTAGAPATATLAAVGGSSSTSHSGTYGALYRLTFKDAAGVATSLVGDEAFTITPSGANISKATVSSGAFASVAPTAATAVSFGAADLVNGNGFMNVDATAAATTVVLTGAGTGTLPTTLTTTASFTSAAAAATSGTLVFAGAAAANNVVTTGWVGTTLVVPSTSTSDTIELTRATTTAIHYGYLTVVDTLGLITGVSQTGQKLTYDRAYSMAAATGYATVSIAHAACPAGTAACYNVTDSASTSLGNVASAAATLSSSSGSVTVLSPSATVRLAAAGTVSFTVKVRDQFRNAVPATPVTVSFSGRNSAKTSATVSTDASGNAVYSFTDAGTTGTTDTITFSASGAVTTATVTYGENTAGSVLVATPSTNTVTATTNAGADKYPVTYSEINAAGTYLSGAEAGQVTVTALVKDATGNVMSGMPVVWTVTGTGCAITSTTATTYTGANGQATASLYAWLLGNCVVTATSGGKSDTANSYWAQTGTAEVRTISSTVTGGSIVVVAKDRFGNPIPGVPLKATRTSGSGSFGGSSSATGTTDAAGSQEFIVSNGDAKVTITFNDAAASTYGQSDALKGYVDGTVAGATNVFLAYTAGTALVDEEGVGASFDAAGVNSLTVDAGSADTAQAAADAAAEATDAANAATDAANAAAEAADAATAAAQDAADAVAALSTQVSEMVNALKKQITALTNLVIKIQKKVRA
jgi:trimeric autotransporter adhesin